MGCIQAKEKEEPVPEIGSTDGPVKTVDPRLPFESYRQLFQMKNSWKSVGRSLTAAAKDNLIRFFAAHPEHKALHKKLVNLETEEEMLESTSFENSALEVFNTFDEFIETMEKLDFAIDALKRAGKAHAKLEGFSADYFKDMEDSFIRACGDVLGDRFTDATEQNFRRLYQFVTAQMIEGYTDAGGAPPNRI